VKLPRILLLGCSLVCLTTFLVGGCTKTRQGHPFREFADTGHAVPHAFLLHPGSDLHVLVDPSQRLHPVNRLVGGVSFHRLAGWGGYPFDQSGKYTLTSALEEKIRALQLPLTRFYAVGEEQFTDADGDTGEIPSLRGAIDRAAVISARLGIPEERIVLELEDQGERSVLSDSTWAAAVRYSLARGYGFRIWEIGNEPSVEGSVFKTPGEYVHHFNRVSTAIKNVQPGARTILSVHQDDVWFGKDLIAGAAGHYDLVAPHWYGYTDEDFEETVLGGNAETVRRIARLDEYLRRQNPGRSVGQFDTEWGLLVEGTEDRVPEHNVRNGNILGTAYRAVRLISYLNDNLMAAASGWEMFVKAPAYGCCIMAVGPPVQECMLYWFYYYFNRMLGDWTVAGSGVAPQYTILGEGSLAGTSVPETPTLVTVSDDGTQLFLCIVNASWTKDRTAVFSLRDAYAVEAQGVALSDDHLDGIPVVKEEKDFVRPLTVECSATTIRFDLPRHAVVFVRATLGNDREGTTTPRP
jgi:hypothetical protein